VTPAAASSSVLDAVVAGVREDLDARRAALPEADLEALAAEAPAPPSFAAALRRPAPGPGAARPRVIAEMKRASPSRGAIAPSADAALVARGYVAAGAAAVSVLTEGRRFGGSLEDLARASIALEGTAPLLRKDFVLERYQVLEARAAGASAVLLIAALLPPGPLAALLGAAREAGLDALVEVHDEAELDRALSAGAAIVGVNNRDLRTLAVDLAVSERLAPRIPAAAIRVAESGIRTRAEMERLAAAGFDAFLVGERLMGEPDPGAALARLLSGEGAA
jgi:indole-3-glycerol phosphate synthase